MNVFRSVWGWLVVGLFLLLVGLVFLLKDEGGSGLEEAEEVARPRLTALAKSLGSAVVRREVKIAGVEPEDRGIDPYEDWETEKILKHFGFPAGVFVEASLADVVDYLETDYLEYGGRGIEFRIEGDGGFPITCEFGNVSARGLMDLVAGLGGYELEVGDGEVVFRRRQAADPHSSLVMALRPGWLRALGAGEDADAAEAVGGALAGWGVDVESLKVDEPGVEGDPLRVVLTADQGHRAMAVYNFGMEPTNAGQVKIASKVIRFEDGSARIEPQTLGNSVEYADTLRDLSLEGELELTSAPSVVVSAGQRAKVEIIREHVYPVGDATAGEATKHGVRNVGYEMEVEVAVLGLDRMEIKGSTSHTMVGDQTLGDVQAGKDLERSDRVWDEDAFRTLETGFEGAVFDGNTARFLAAEEGDTGLQQFITLERVGEDGGRLLE